MKHVVHCKKQKYDIYIGRPSKWGNPFEIGKDGTREKVCQKYKDWITKGAGRHLLNDLHELKDKVLGCWCHPKQCHGEILHELATANNTPQIKVCPECGRKLERPPNDKGIYECFWDMSCGWKGKL